MESPCIRSTRTWVSRGLFSLYSLKILVYPNKWHLWNEFFWKAKIVSQPSQSEQENGITVSTLFPTPVMNSISRKEKKMQLKCVIPSWNQTLVGSGSPPKWFCPFLSQGQVTTSGGTVGKGGIAADIYQAEAGMLLKRLTIHRTTSTTKNSRAPNVHPAAVEKPCCKVLCHHSTYIMPDLREIFEGKLSKYSCICFIDKILVLNICMWLALHLFICLVSLFIQLMCIYMFTLCRGSKYSHSKEE